MQASRPIQYQIGEPTARLAQRVFENETSQCGMPMSYLTSCYPASNIPDAGIEGIQPNNLTMDKNDTQHHGIAHIKHLPHSPLFGFDGNVVSFNDTEIMLDNILPLLNILALI